MHTPQLVIGFKKINLCFTTASFSFLNRKNIAWGFFSSMPHLLKMNMLPQDTIFYKVLQNTITEEKAIALVETNRVVAGILGGDAMLKRGAAELMDARYVCVGKFIVLILGETRSVQEALQACVEAAGDYLQDQLFIPNVHPAVLAAMDKRIPAGHGG